jgi:hypothetical protein
MTTALIGVPSVMTQNTVYATPTRSCNGFVSPAAAVVQASIDQVTWITQTLFEGYLSTSGPFIRCTDVAGCEVIFKVI